MKEVGHVRFELTYPFGRSSFEQMTHNLADDGGLEPLDFLPPLSRRGLRRPVVEHRL